LLKKIIVTKGVGEGQTELAAFDGALVNAGIANYNLIYLSSVIPVGAKVLVRRYSGSEKEFGHKLYVVMSKVSCLK
jgi:arginine decarboxylase